MNRNREDLGDFGERYMRLMDLMQHRGRRVIVVFADPNAKPKPLSPWKSLKTGEVKDLFGTLKRRVSDRPVIDEERYTVTWKERSAFLGATYLCALMKLLIELDGGRLHHDGVRNLLNDPEASEDAVRQAVSRLRQKLRRHGLHELAERIVSAGGRNQEYVLDLVGRDNRDQ